MRVDLDYTGAMMSDIAKRLASQIDRSRTAVRASRESVARSRLCIDHSRSLIARRHQLVIEVRSFAMPAGGALSEAQLGEVAQRWDALTEQREIDSEVERTLGDRRPRLARPAASPAG